MATRKARTRRTKSRRAKPKRRKAVIGRRRPATGYVEGPARIRRRKLNGISRRRTKKRRTIGKTTMKKKADMKGTAIEVAKTVAGGFAGAVATEIMPTENRTTAALVVAGAGVLTAAYADLSFGAGVACTSLIAALSESTKGKASPAAVAQNIAGRRRRRRLGAVPTEAEIRRAIVTEAAKDGLGGIVNETLTGGPRGPLRTNSVELVQQEELQTPMKMQPTTPTRALYDRLEQIYAKTDKAIITPGVLRLEQPLSAANRYKFAVLQDETTNAAPARPSEIRLRRADAFHVSEMAFFVGKRKLSDPYSALQLETFANSAVFTNAAELLAVQALMNGGQFSIEVDNVKFIVANALRSSRYVSTAQAGLLVADGSDAYGDSAFDRDKVLDPYDPALRLNGGSNNDLQVWVNEPVNLTATGEDEENVLVWWLGGFLVSNGARYKSAGS